MARKVFPAEVCMERLVELGRYSEACSWSGNMVLVLVLVDAFQKCSRQNRRKRRNPKNIRVFSEKHETLDVLYLHPFVVYTDKQLSISKLMISHSNALPNLYTISHLTHCTYS